MIAGNVVFHAEVLLKGRANYGIRIAIAAVILLISLVGGRIVPSFTGNWLTRNNPGRRPVPFTRFDMATIAVTALALDRLDRGAGACRSAAACCWSPACLQIARLARWAGDRTFADRLVLVLHVGYAFVPLGFLLIGAVGLHGRRAGERRHPRLDRRRDRPDDAGGDDARHARPYRPAAAGGCRDASDLRAACWSRALLRIAAAFVPSMMLLEAGGTLLDRRLCGLCVGLWTAAGACASRPGPKGAS